MKSLKDFIFYPVTGYQKISESTTKISIIGAGGIGMAAAYTIALKGICDELALVDVNDDRVEGEQLDLNLGHEFLSHTNIIGGSDYAISKRSNIVLVCISIRRGEKESYGNLIQRNVDVFKFLIPQIVKHSPDCILIIASQPVDILSYIAWKLSGLPRNKVFGTGTMLDSSRFKYLLGKKLGVSSKCIQAFIIGQQGENSVPIWSNINVSGNQLVTLVPKMAAPDDPDDFSAIFKDVITSSNKVIYRKGSAYWANGAAIGVLCDSLLGCKNEIFPLSTLVKHDGLLTSLNVIDKEIFLSLPCVVNNLGITHIMPIVMTEHESLELSKTAKKMEDSIRDIKW